MSGMYGLSLVNKFIWPSSEIGSGTNSLDNKKLKTIISELLSIKKWFTPFYKRWLIIRASGYIASDQNILVCCKCGHLRE